MEEIQHFEYHQDYCTSVCNREIRKQLKSIIQSPPHLSRCLHSHLVQRNWGPTHRPSSV